MKTTTNTPKTPKVTLRPEGFEEWTAYADGVAVLNVTVKREVCRGDVYKSFQIRRIGNPEVLYANRWFDETRKAVKVLALEPVAAV